MQETRAFLKRIGLPEGDAYALPDSKQRFEDGGQYRFEVPGIQGPSAMKALLESVEREGIHLHRVTQTKGIMSLLDEEITQMVGLADEYQVDLYLAIGPRATTDTSASVNTAEGCRMGYRLRGQEQIVRAIEEVKRATRLGCRGILVYDEGCLWVLNEARKLGEIPPDCKFKMSAHSGHGNPCSARLLESIGADSFNPVRDIQMQMLSAIRQSVGIPLDVHTENPKSSGGFIRHYEVPEMVRVASPIYLKTGGSVAQTHSWDSSDADARQRAKQVLLVKRVLDEYYPEAKQSPKRNMQVDA
ncbi:peptidase [Eggerthella guodeyinii]|uniref:Peptidase n=2 Tax=Eggerthella guodeyinii TaxID=2690837 RepID=A0A6L7IS87_9ACTN|nr:peptidase [Eggerthella guodeyinii]